jgi:trehalose-6-phosphatase
MFGDDLTDEHAFRAAEALGGFGVLVGPMRETAARYRLDGVPEVLDWLEAVAAALGEGGRGMTALAAAPARRWISPPSATVRSAP